jgi:triosephosphate isomerase
LGVTYTIVGHSERRGYFGETDKVVCAKAAIALEHGISPIICVGETLEQRENDLTMDLIAFQIRAALLGKSPEDIKRCVISYEPIWAIGTGLAASAEQTQEVCKHIRGVIRKIAGTRISRSVSILYGGSMNEDNAPELLSMPDIDGGLIGGASLTSEGLLGIIKVAHTLMESEQ